jgi:hypothetical protein
MYTCHSEYSEESVSDMKYTDSSVVPTLSGLLQNDVLSKASLSFPVSVNFLQGCANLFHLVKIV